MGGRRGLPSELLASLWREALVLLPLLADVAFLLGRELPQRLVLLAGGVPLLRGQLCPRLHLLLHPLLFFRRHARVALRDPAPLLLALGIKLVPFAGERC